MRVNFQAYPASRKLRFTCCSCGKGGRTKTIRHECTVNPFNRGPDGIPLGPDEVRKQSADRVAEDVAKFLAEPVCRKCEDAMTYSDRRALIDRRRNAMEAAE